jgi:hypothetical protein
MGVPLLVVKRVAGGGAPGRIVGHRPFRLRRRRLIGGVRVTRRPRYARRAEAVVQASKRRYRPRFC